MNPGKTFRRIGLRTKITVATTFAIILTTVAGSSYFYAKTKIIVFDNLQGRGRTICENLSYSAKYGVLTEDTEVLNELAEGVMTGEDVAYVIIQDEDGKTLVEKTVVEVPMMAFLKKRAGLGKVFQMLSARDKFGNPIYDFACPIITKKAPIKTPAMG